MCHLSFNGAKYGKLAGSITERLQHCGLQGELLGCIGEKGLGPQKGPGWQIPGLCSGDFVDRLISMRNQQCDGYTPNVLFIYLTAIVTVSF